MLKMMNTCKRIMWLVAMMMVVATSCKEESPDDNNYVYYMTIQSQVSLNLKDTDESQGSMADPSVDLLSKTVARLLKAVRDNESYQGDAKSKQAHLLMTCDSIYREYVDVNPVNHGKTVCFVKLIRVIDTDGVKSNAVTLQTYHFWSAQPIGDEDDDTPKPNQYLAKPDSLQAIDLGLSVLWASCNLGGKQPRDYGPHLAWGDPTGSLWSAQGIGRKNNAYTWNTSNYGGNNPPEDISGSALDVVTLNWGESWRIPTYAEARELVEQCQWKLRTYGDIKWYEVIGPNGNSIIMPLAGVYGDDLGNASARFHLGPLGVNETGIYWTASSCTTPGSTEHRGYAVNEGVITAWAFRFYSGYGDSSPEFVDLLRAYHMSIRPVHDK